MSIKLSNKCKPVVWLAREGWGCERPFIGVVLAYSPVSHHNFILWDMSSDDGEVWDTFNGGYFHEMSEAVDFFNIRVGTYYRTAQCPKAEAKREERELVEWLNSSDHEEVEL